MNDSMRLLTLLRERDARRNEPHRKYLPYQPQKEFHTAGKYHCERCLMAGNQLGKTLSGAMEAYYHASGRYPPGWDGAVFTKPTVGWIGGDTGETITKTTQRILLGRPGEMDGHNDHYTGIIPLRDIADSKSALGTPDLLAWVKVKHKAGGESIIYFLSYAKGRQKWQGDTVDWVWYDEEPPQDIYSEGLTRTNAGQLGQMSWLTFTPLLGMSEVVSSFLLDPSAQQVVIKMTIEDVAHYSDEEKLAIVASYPAHERDARAKGIPIMGSGLVFPVTESSISVAPFKIPAYWALINGLDFGSDHPSAAVACAWDKDADVFYVTKGFRKNRAGLTPGSILPVAMAAACKPWGYRIPVAWPHDGLQHDKGSGVQLAKQYQAAGMNMLRERATFDDGTYGVEAGIMDMFERMESGRFKVFSNVVEYFEELRLYHRKDGQIVKLRDDLICASRYALMMKRYARPAKQPRQVTIPPYSPFDSAMGY